MRGRRTQHGLRQVPTCSELSDASSQADSTFPFVQSTQIWGCGHLSLLRSQRTTWNRGLAQAKHPAIQRGGFVPAAPLPVQAGVSMALQ